MISSGCALIADARVIVQIAEPQHGVDRGRNAARDAAFEHPRAGIAAEIGFDERLGDAAERVRFDRKRQRRREPAQRRDLPVGKTVRRVRRPRRIDAIHFADDGVGAEAVDHRDEFGHAGLEQIGEHRKLGDRLRIAAAAAAPRRRFRPNDRTDFAASAPASRRRWAGHIRWRSFRPWRRATRRRGRHRSDATCR